MSDHPEDRAFTLVVSLILGAVSIVAMFALADCREDSARVDCERHWTCVPREQAR